MSERKQVCRGCGWQGLGEQVLSAPNPFDRMDTVDGCPSCKAVNRMRTVCDEPGCWSEDVAGLPTPNGYRRVCYPHSVMLEHKFQPVARVVEKKKTNKRKEAKV